MWAPNWLWLVSEASDVFLAVAGMASESPWGVAGQTKLVLPSGSRYCQQVHLEVVAAVNLIQHVNVREKKIITEMCTVNPQ